MCLFTHPKGNLTFITSGKEGEEEKRIFFLKRNFLKVVQVQNVHINHIIIIVLPPVSSRDLCGFLYGRKSMMTRFLVACWASMLDSFFFSFFFSKGKFLSCLTDWDP